MVFISWDFFFLCKFVMSNEIAGLNGDTQHTVSLTSASEGIKFLNFSNPKLIHVSFFFFFFFLMLV